MLSVQKVVVNKWIPLFVRELEGEYCIIILIILLLLFRRYFAKKNSEA